MEQLPATGPSFTPSLISHARHLAALGALALACACAAPEKPAQAAVVVPPGEVRIPQDSPKRAFLQVEPVTESNERALATLPAQVVPNEEHTVRVNTPVAGRVVSLDVRPGDRVAAGQPIAHIRSADAAQAASDVSKAAAALRVTRASLARTTDLFEHKVTSARELEQARADEAQSRAEYERARARATQLGGSATGVVSDVYVLRAPITGVVIDRSTNAGAEVRPDNGGALFIISSLDAVWLSVSVPQRDLAAVHRGAKVTFTTESAPGRTFTGAVSFVSDALDPATHMATARAVVPNPGGALHLLVTGEVRLVTTEATAFTVIPSRALVTHADGPVVFVEQAPGRFVRRPVTVRDDDGTRATITEGVRAGERVVTTGSLLLAAEADRGH